MATEKRLIDATPIIDECKECSALEWNKSVYTTWAEAEEDFMQRLLDAPTVDAVEVVHGRWEFEDDTRMIWTTKAICSVCKCVVAHNVDLSMEWGRKYHVEKNKYCPNCGAKMDGDGNG